jgi:cytochrome c553
MWQRWKRLKTGEKVLFGVVGLLVLVTVVNYAILEGIRMSSDKPLYPIRTRYEFAGEGFRGSELFRTYNCTNCHKAVGNGTNMGLELDGIGSRHDLAYISAFLRDPEATYRSSTIDHGAPPKEAAYVSRLPPDDMRAIAIFLSQLKADRGAPSAAAPPVGKSGFIDAMVDMWVPDSWRILFSDVRAQDAHGAGAKPAAPPASMPGTGTPGTGTPGTSTPGTSAPPAASKQGAKEQAAGGENQGTVNGY